MTPDIVSLTEARLDSQTAPLIHRFEADTTRMKQERRASGSYRPAAILVDIRSFGWHALERYRDTATLLLTGTPEPPTWLSEVEAMRLLARTSADLTALCNAARSRLRETASMTGTRHLIGGLQDDLSRCARACETQLAAIISARRQAARPTSLRVASEFLRRLGRRWMDTFRTGSPPLS
jgi:hypothetical protein